MAKLALYLLGSARIERDGLPIQVDTRKAVALLVYLVMSDQPQSRETLAALFWPENDQESSRAALRRTLSALHKAVGEGCLDITRERISLSPGIDLWLDVAQFRLRLAECAGHSHGHSHATADFCEECIASLSQAIDLYRGDFLTGFSLRDSVAFDDWQFFQTDSLRREFAGALEKLARCYAAQAGFDTAIKFARRWLALDLLLEDAHRLLMQLYAWDGQRNAALRQYRECVRTLEQELGVPPLDETTQLYQAILEGQAPPPPLLVRDEVPATSPVAIPSLPSLLSQIPPASQTIYPLVGRTWEWDALLRAYHQDAAGGYFFLLEGEAGIGKTRLAEEFLAYARQRGSITMVARCYEGETHLAYGPFIEALASAMKQPDTQTRMQAVSPQGLSETARLLPEMAAQISLPPPTPPSFEGPGAQSRFFEGLRQVLVGICSGASPGIFFLDDLHWADVASLDLLLYLVRRLGGQAMLILGTWRSEGMPASHRLYQLLTEVQRAGRGKSITLPRLSPADLDNLVGKAQVAGVSFSEALRQRLYRETEGLPFFAVEYLESFIRSGEKSTNADWEMPHSVRDLLHLRLSTVGETGWQLLATAAVIGRSFDFDTLRAASGRSELETVTGLEQLIAGGLIRERQNGDDAHTPVYDFSHEKLRQLVYEETILARRRLLHRRVAEALTSQGRGHPEPGTSASQVARHYQLAGEETLAADYFKQAGEQARAVYANTEALAHFRTALALGHPGADQIHAAIGDLQTLSGEYSAAIASYETAAAICGPLCLSILEQKLGNIHHRRGEWELAESHFQAALEARGEQGVSGDTARLFADWSLTAYQLGQLERAQELAQRALELAESASDPLAHAQAHNVRGILARNQGDFDLACYHLGESLQVAEKMKDASARVAALNNLAQVYKERRDLDGAISLTEDALKLCVQLGDYHREAALRNNLADLFHAVGRSEEAMQQLKKAVVIFADIGLDAGSPLPEIWKLTEW